MNDQNNGFDQNNGQNNNGYNPYDVRPEGYYGTPELERRQKSNGMLALLSMIFGIASLVMSCCCFFISPALGIAAIVLAACAKREEGAWNGFAVTGLVCGILGLIMGLAVIMFYALGIALGMLEEGGLPEDTIGW